MKTATATPNRIAYATKGRVNLEQLKQAPARRNRLKLRKLAAIATASAAVLIPTATAAITTGPAFALAAIPAAIITAAALQEIENELKK